MLKDEMPKEYIINNLLSDIFRDDDLCKNIAENKHMMFSIDPKDYLKASRLGEIISFYHLKLLRAVYSRYEQFY